MRAGRGTGESGHVVRIGLEVGKGREAKGEIVGGGDMGRGRDAESDDMINGGMRRRWEEGEMREEGRGCKESEGRTQVRSEG